MPGAHHEDAHAGDAAVREHDGLIEVRVMEAGGGRKGAARHGSCACLCISLRLDLRAEETRLQAA